MWAYLPCVVRGLPLSKTPTNPSNLFYLVSVAGEKVLREGGPPRGSQIKELRVWCHSCEPALVGCSPALCLLPIVTQDRMMTVTPGSGTASLLRDIAGQSPGDVDSHAMLF